MDKPQVRKSIKRIVHEGFADNDMKSALRKIHDIADDDKVWEGEEEEEEGEEEEEEEEEEERSLLDTLIDMLPDEE